MHKKPMTAEEYEALFRSKVASYKASIKSAVGDSKLAKLMQHGWADARANPRSAALGFAAAGVFGMVRRDDQGPLESAIVLGPLFTGIALSLRDGGFTAAKTALGQARSASGMLFRAPGDWKGPAGEAFRAEFETASATNPFIKNFGGLNPNFGHTENLLRAKQLTHEEIMSSLTGSVGRKMKALAKQLGIDKEDTAAIEALAAPKWMTRAAVSAKIATSDIPQVNNIAAAMELGVYDELSKGLLTPQEILSAAAGNEDFARSFAQKLPGFSRAKIDDVMISQGGTPTIKMTRTNFDRKRLAGALAAQGREDLAEQVGKLPAQVRVTGISASGGPIHSLEYDLGSGSRRFTVPVADDAGMVRSGLNQRNLYVARRQIYMGSLEATLGGAKAEILEMDHAIAKYITDYWSLAKEQSTMRGFSSFLAGMGHMSVYGMGHDPLSWSQTGSALVWGHDSQGGPGKMEQIIRRLERQITGPQNEEVARLFGVESHFDIWNGSAIPRSNVILALGREGYVTAGSEGSARVGAFYDIHQLSRLGIGSYTNPLDKSITLIRDKSKGYWVTGGGTLQNRKFQTKLLKRVSGKNVGLSVQFQAIMESEEQFLSKLATRSTRGTPKEKKQAIERMNRFLRKMGIEDKKELAEYRRALATVADMREGIFVAGVPEGTFMTTQRSTIVKATASDLKSYIGKSLPTNMSFGTDASDKHMYPSWGRLGGKDTSAVLQSIEAVEGGFKVSWEEHIAMSGTKHGTVKSGSDLLKGFGRPAIAGDDNRIMRIINHLRKTRKYSDLYSNQPFIPLLSAVSDNTIQAFTLAKTLEKVQNLEDVLLSNISGMMSSMNKAGQERILKKLGRFGISGTAGNLELSFRGVGGNAARVKRYQSIHRVSKSLFAGIVLAPERYGLPANMFANVAGTGVAVGSRTKILIERGLAAFGAISEMTPWDALMLSVPSSVPISSRHFEYLNELGFKNIVNELLGRVSLMGDAAETGNFYNLLKEWSKMASTGHGKLTTPVNRINLEDTQIGVAPSTRWRKGDKYASNFVIDLETSKSALRAGAIKERFGTTQILVPGTSTDMWTSSYRIPSTGQVVSAESWLDPFDAMMKAFRSADETGSERYLDVAQVHLERVQDAWVTMSANNTLGRSGAVKDMGRAMSGKVVFRNYREMYATNQHFKGLATRAIIGLHPRDYRRVTGKKHFDPKNLQKGISHREPITTIDPAVFVVDDGIREGTIGADESFRMMKAMDYDGETIQVQRIMNEGSLRDIEGWLTGESPGGKKYRALLETRKALGGVMDDLSELAKTGSFPNIQEGVVDRLGRFRFFDPENPSVQSELVAKISTAHIGVYSNLSKQLIFASQTMSESMVDRALRVTLANDLQQVAIDFARKSKGIDGPGELASVIKSGIFASFEGDISTANANFAGVAEKLGYVAKRGNKYKMAKGTGFRDSLNILAKQYRKEGGLKRAKRVVEIKREAEKMLSGWFSPLDTHAKVVDFKHRYQTWARTYQKGLNATIDVEDAAHRISQRFAQLASMMQARSDAAGFGVTTMGVTGAAAESSRETLTIMNRVKAAAAGTGHTVKDLWTIFKASPRAKSLAAGAAATGALMALFGTMTSPTEMHVPEYEGRQRALMMAPDVAMAGGAGTLAPGSAFGHSMRPGEFQSPRRVEANQSQRSAPPRKYYVQQTNRTPRARLAAQGDPYDANQYAEEVSAGMQRMAGGNMRVNVVHDATSRRRSELEMQDQLLSDMRGGRG